MSVFPNKVEYPFNVIYRRRTCAWIMLCCLLLLPGSNQSHSSKKKF